MTNEDLPVKPRLRGVTHGLALIASVPFGVALARRSVTDWRWVAIIPYIAGVGTMFLWSTRLHAVPFVDLRERERRRRFDLAGIVAAIAGTATPPVLLLDGGWLAGAYLVWVGALWSAFVVLLIVALRGRSAISAEPQYRVALAGTYVAVSVVTCILLVQALRAHPAVRTWLLAGGLCHLAGAAVYALRWPGRHATVFGYHELFHVATVVGAALHYVATVMIVDGAG